MPKRIYDWKEIQEYFNEGHGFVECQKKFGFSHTAWVKAIKRGQLDAGTSEFVDRRRKYDWAEIQAYYDEGNSYRQCALRFGFAAQAWAKAKLRGEIKPRGHMPPLEKILATSRSRWTIKRRLLLAGLIVNRCDECGISEWRGKALSIHIDHINGVKHDHRLENLRMLCPNCHSQTETYGAKNLKRRRLLQDNPLDV